MFPSSSPLLYPVLHYSIELARTVLSEYHHSSHNLRPFFNPSKLCDAHVLELGSGVGLLGCLLAPLVKHYIVTDLPEMLPLIQRNMEHQIPKTSSPLASRGRRKGNRPPLGSEAQLNYTVAALDWTDVASSAPNSTARRLIRSSVLGSSVKGVDLIIAVDTLYNTALVPPFLATLEEFSQEGTAVLVVCELRDEDVIRVFLEGWLSLGSWEVWRVGGRTTPGTHNVGDGAGEEEKTFEPFLNGPFVSWLGWKS